ncbi:MAG: type V CRISPR-associated protein Cas12a/Cpf1, partial [Clostridia bacterium]|nr:type V CRISPR-associated protein Cas12a/Cpf1 [Clostridia bacterium]
MMDFTKFQNLYPVMKGIKFRLVPDEITQEWLNRDQAVLNEQIFGAKVEKAKELITDFHKAHITRNLEMMDMSEILEIVSNYLSTKTYITAKGEELVDDKGTKAYDAMLVDICKKVSVIMDHVAFDSGKKTIDMCIESRSLFTDDDINLLDEVSAYSSSFGDFCKIRKFLYSPKGESNTIGNRIVEIAVDVIGNRNKLATFPDELKQQIEETELDGCSLLSYFDIETFDQASLDLYNTGVSGIAREDGTKEKGINEIINIYNQLHKKEEGYKALPMFLKLKKIPLLDSTTESFKLSSLNSDQECIDMVAYTIDTVMHMIIDMDPVGVFNEYLSIFNMNDLVGINVKKNSLSNLSHKAYGNWAVIGQCIDKKYDAEIGNPKKKPATYQKEKDKWLANKSEYDLKFLTEAVDTYAKSVMGDEGKRIGTPSITLLRSIITELDNSVRTFEEVYNLNRDEFDIPYPETSYLNKDSEKVQIIKNTISPIIDIHQVLSNFSFKRIDEFNIGFYSKVEPMIDILKDADRSYNKIRNHVVKDVDDSGKIKFNFGNPFFGSTFDGDKMSTSGIAIMKQGEAYYILAVPRYDDSKARSALVDLMSTYADHESDTKIMVYKQLSSPFKTLPNIFLNSKKFDDIAEKYGLTERVLRLYEAYKKRKEIDWNQKDEVEIVEYLIKALKMHNINKFYEFDFKEASAYSGLAEFYADVDKQTYKVKFESVSEEMLNEYISKGLIYKFRISSRHLDGSSKGKSLHSEYFKGLFSEENMKETVYKLNATSSIYYRPRKIAEKDIIKHPAGKPIECKTKPGEFRTFDYDIIKDRRYTREQYEIHLTIQCNPNANAYGSAGINQSVRNEIVASNGNFNVLSIDRGEQNLVYVTVINSRTNEILEQKSLNIIGNQDYKEKIKDKSRKMSEDKAMVWKYDNDIKNMKSGYLSLCISEVVNLMMKYNAVIIMEKLDKKFKNSRVHIGHDMYSQFEAALINKLNYYVNKHEDAESSSGVRGALQLTGEFKSFKRLGTQSGVIFYVNPAYTSKIDPMTGYIDRFSGKCGYETIKKSIEFIEKINYIDYGDNMIRFGVEMNKFFPNADEGECWTLKVIRNVNDERVEIWFDKERGGKKCDRDINLYREWLDFFMDNDIDVSGPNETIKEDILSEKRSAAFYKEFLRLFSLTSQIRNIYTTKEEGYVLSPISINGNAPFDSREGD